MQQQHQQNTIKSQFLSKDPNEINLFNSPQEAEHWVNNNPQIALMIIPDVTDDVDLQALTNEELVQMPHFVAAALITPSGQATGLVRFLEETQPNRAAAEDLVTLLRMAKTQEEAKLAAKQRDLSLISFYDASEPHPNVTNGTWDMSFIMVLIFGSKDDYDIAPFASFTAEFPTKEACEQQYALFNTTKEDAVKFVNANLTSSPISDLNGLDAKVEVITAEPANDSAEPLPDTLD